MALSSAAHSDKDPALVIQKYIKEFLDLAFRRKWLILSCVILGTAIGVALAWLKVDIYRSETVILVEQQKIPEKYVPSVVGGSMAERVSTMTQQVLSRTNLQKVIDEFHLFAEEIRSQGYDVVIEGLKKNIKIETKGSGGQIEAFTISFAHRDPMMAMKVTSRLASQYIDENIKIREQFIEGATEFLDEELAKAKEGLDQKEKELADYKLKYLGELPKQLELNLRTLDRLQDEKTRIQEAMNSIYARLEALEKTIREYEANPGLTTDTQGPIHQGSADPLILRSQELKRELAKLSSEYTDSYPDVIHLKMQIRDVESELANRHSEGGQVPADPYLAELTNTRKELNFQLAAMKSQLTTVSNNMKELERRIERTPHHEQEFLALERDYDNMQKHYQQVHANRTSAGISENLDKRQKGERFRILDPANLPTKPEGMRRELIAGGGVGFGIGLGFGLAFLLDVLWPTFRRSEDAEIYLGLATLATIPSFTMAYGKSMKMVPSELEAQNGANGKHLPSSQANDSLLNMNRPQVVEAEGGGRSSGSPWRSSREAISPQVNLVTKWRPQSIVAEQYRVGATRLDFLLSSAAHQVVLITSAMKGEGKTSTSANFAYTLARDLDEPTLVIDCDFKCSNLHNIFGLSREPGIADFFAGVEPLEACLQHVPGMPLSCLAVGNVSRYPIPFSKLSQLSTILEQVKSRYRFIILDGPPVLPLADVNVLTELAHIVLMVVRSGAAPKDVVHKALAMIHHTGPIRLVLTDAWTQGVPYYARKGYLTPYSLSSPS